MSAKPRSADADHGGSVWTAASPQRTTDCDERTRRAATEAMCVVQEAPDLFTVYSGASATYTVDTRGRPSCLCDDFLYRSETIAYCKHAARVLLTLGEIDIPFDRCDVDATLVHQWRKYQTDGAAGLGYAGGDGQ